MRKVKIAQNSTHKILYCFKYTNDFFKCCQNALLRTVSPYSSYHFFPSEANQRQKAAINVPAPHMYRKYAIHKYLTVNHHKIHAIIVPKLPRLLLLRKYLSIKLTSFSSILSDTQALSDPVNKVSNNAFRQKIIDNQTKLSVNGIKNNVIAERTYPKMTLNFFPYKSAITPVGISQNNPTTLLKLEINAICRKSSHIEIK